MHREKASSAQLGAWWDAWQLQGDRSAREQLLLHYLYLVKYAVGRMLVTLPPHLDGDDLIGYGLMGLIQSLEKYDRDRKVKFETFAMTRIRGAILDELRAQDWMPRSLRRKAREIEQAIHGIEQHKGSPATEAEIAAALAISPQELQNVLSDTAYLVVSLDYLLSADSSTLGTLDIPDDLSHTAAERLQGEAVQQALQAAIQGLPEREQRLVSLYYYEGLTMKEIGRVLQVTEARVCQLHAQSVLRLRARMQSLF
jgi:RNA polymerase sigma factor for flagellar operon FliA